MGAALLVSTATAVLPLLWCRYLPLQDYPQHRLVAEVLARYDEPGADYCRYFERDLRLRPYVGAYGLAWLLYPHVAPDAALRLSLAIYLVGTPLAVRAYAREIAPGRSSAAILAVPALFTAPYYQGFINYLMGVPAVFLGLAAALRFTRCRSVASCAAFLASAACAYLCHVSCLAVLLVTVLAVSLMTRGLTRLVLSLLSLAIGAAAVVGARSDIDAGASWGYLSFGEDLPPQDEDRGIIFVSPIYSLLSLIPHVASDAKGIDGALWGIPLGALIVAARGAGRLALDAARPERLVLPAVCILGLLGAPNASAFSDALNTRLLTFVFLSLPSLLPERFLDRRTCVTLMVFVAASLAVSLSLHARFDREAREIDPVIEALPAGASVAPVIVEPRSKALLWTTPYVHAGHYVQAIRGGLGRETFEGPQIPVRTRPEGRTGMALLSARPWLLTANVLRIVPEFILMRGRGEGLVPPTHRLLLRSGAFTLYRREE